MAIRADAAHAVARGALVLAVALSQLVRRRELADEAAAGAG